VGVATVLICCYRRRTSQACLANTWKSPVTYLDDSLVGILHRSDCCVRRLGSRVQCGEYPRIVPVEIKLPILVLALFLDHRPPIPLQGQGVIQVRIDDTLQERLYRRDLADVRIRQNEKETP
jgi:hypothetical protein